MNRFTLLLTLSLAANGVLAVLLLSPRSATVSRASPFADSGAVLPTSATVAKGDSTSAASDQRSSDAAYVARLRAAGLPADIIRDLVYTRISERYRVRRAALLPEPKDEYWRATWFFGGTTAVFPGPRSETPEQRAQLRELKKSLEAEVRALLGDGPEALGYDERLLRDQMGGSLSNDKVQQIEAIRKDYDELTAQIRDRSKGMILKADREQLRLLERERRKDMEAMFTPEELLEYDLRASPTADGVRNRLAYFEPTEQEFRELTKLQLEFDRQYGRNNLTGAEADRRKAAEKDLLVRIQATLSPERFADYKVSIDGMFSATSDFVSAYNLDARVAKDIVALKQRTWQRIDALDQAGATADLRAATLAELQQQIDAEMTARLGADIYAKYKKTGGSWWMERAKPAPASRPHS